MQTLLLPGMDGTGRLFSGLQAHLRPELQARAVAYPANEPLGYGALLKRIDVPTEPFAIVAESFSGPLGIRLALQHVDRVRALILVATFVRNPTRFAAQLGSLLGPYLFHMKPRTAALRSLLLGGDANDDAVEAVRSAVGAVTPSVMSRRLKEIITVDVEREFAALSVPTLYLAGSRDRLVGMNQLRKMKRLRPDLETAEIDAPHLVLQAEPVKAAKVVNTFLARFCS